MVLIRDIAFVLAIVATSLGAKIDPQTLGVAGSAAFEKHQRLFEIVVPKFEATTKLQVNSNIDALTHLIFYHQQTPLAGKLEISIPFEINEHIFDFRTLEILGTGLNAVTRISVDSGEAGNPVVGMISQRENRIQIKVNSFMVALNKPLTVVIEGAGFVEKIQFVHAEGIATKFDASIYREPGIDQPVKSVSVKVDATRLRSIGGICELKRDRYFRYYAAPNSDRSGKEPYFKNKGFLPGRQVEQIGPAYEDRWGAASAMSSLTEDPDRTGFADPSFFEQREFWRFEGVDPDLEFVMCFDDWPRFMWPTNLPGVSNERGTPSVEHFDAAADVVVRLLKAQQRDSGRTANWWEVKNESDVKSEWVYHHEAGYDSWKLLADFHNRVADAIHIEVPNVEVGGPASAWLHPQAGDFRVWKNHRRFMDLTRDHLDFYSHHFYEVGSMDSLARWKREGNSYVQGGLECTIDLLRAHMAATGNNKPLVCSEYGSLSFVRDDRGFWMHIKNINAMLVNFLNRPNDFEITVPFMLTFMHWAPDSLETFIHQTPDGEFVKTKNTFLIDMWEGFKGSRIPSSDSEHKVLTHAVLDGNLIRLVVNNRSGQRAEVDVEVVLPRGSKVVSVKRRMAMFKKGETKFVYDKLLSLERIPLGVDVTAIYEIQLDRVPTLLKVRDETAHYALQTVVEVDGSVELEIPVDAKEPVAAMLRVGLYRKNGFSKPVQLEFNGVAYVVDLAYGEGTPDFMDYVEVPLDPKTVRAENRLAVTVDDPGAIVTVAKIVAVIEYDKQEFQDEN